MPRELRAFAVGAPHYLTPRGNYRQSVFFTDEERRQYLAWLRDSAVRYGMQVWAYCLMPNHIHMVAPPLAEVALARTMQMTHMRGTLNASLCYRG